MRQPIRVFMSLDRCRRRADPATMDEGLPLGCPSSKVDHDAAAGIAMPGRRVVASTLGRSQANVFFCASCHQILRTSNPAYEDAVVATKCN